eukprot:m.162230 g.162230  ORF g.162230 m.162230 type:complete len:60 (+) comp17661_c0_seq14:219-398(+)
MYPVTWDWAEQQRGDSTDTWQHSLGENNKTRGACPMLVVISFKDCTLVFQSERFETRLE